MAGRIFRSPYAHGEIVAVDARCQAIKWQGEPATLLSLRRSLAMQTKALEAGGLQHDAVNVGEACRIVAEHGACEHVPLPAVG